jgi:hypothetical protein
MSESGSTHTIHEEQRRKENREHQLSATMPATSPLASHKGIDKATNIEFVSHYLPNWHALARYYSVRNATVPFGSLRRTRTGLGEWLISR